VQTAYYETSVAGARAILDNDVLKDFRYLKVLSRFLFFAPEMLPVFELFANPRDTALKSSPEASPSVPARDPATSPHPTPGTQVRCDVADSAEAQAWENWLYALPAVAAVTDLLAARLVRDITDESEAARCFRHLAGTLA